MKKLNKNELLMFLDGWRTGSTDPEFKKTITMVIETIQDNLQNKIEVQPQNQYNDPTNHVTIDWNLTSLPANFLHDIGGLDCTAPQYHTLPSINSSFSSHVKAEDIIN